MGRKEKLPRQSSTENAKRDFVDRYHEIAVMDSTIFKRNWELAQLIASSPYVEQLFNVVWSTGSKRSELLFELKSMTYIKRLSSKKFPHASGERICDFIYRSILNNWITLSKWHRMHTHASINELEKQVEQPAAPDATHSTKLSAGLDFKVLVGGHSFRIDDELFQHAMVTLETNDCRAAACLNLKMMRFSEPQIAAELGFSLNSARNHIRRGKQRLRAILVRESLPRPTP